MTLDRTRLQSLTEREQKRFVAERPKSKLIYERGKKIASLWRPHELDGEVGRRFPSGRS